MKHWQQLSLEDKIDILNITSARTGLPQDVIEKDWWVTATLYALSTTKGVNFSRQIFFLRVIRQ